MPRQPRLDAPGALHHVMSRGIEKTNIFRKDEDRADFVQRLAALSGKGALHVYAWSGHSAIMGNIERKWQDREMILECFGKKRRKAVLGYENFVWEGISRGCRPELVGGGLVRSLGGWAQVVSLRKKRIGSSADDRILGSSDFVESFLREAEEKDRETLRLTSKIRDLESLAREIIKREKIKTSELRSGCRKPSVLKARTLFCQIAVKKMGYFGAEVARYLKITTSAVNRRACADELPEAAEYFK